MADKTDITVKDCLQGAFQALLKGDTDERDKLCAMAERRFTEHGGKPLPADTSVMSKPGNAN